VCIPADGDDDDDDDKNNKNCHDNNIYYNRE
jgi:hypothetical protein